MGFDQVGDEAGQCWRDFFDVLEAGVDRVLLYGPPGTGKTYAALHYSAGANLAERLTCTEDLTTGEITGTWMPVGDQKWKWLEGPAIRSWNANGGRGGRLVVDEIDRAMGEPGSGLLGRDDDKLGRAERYTGRPSRQVSGVYPYRPASPGSGPTLE